MQMAVLYSRVTRLSIFSARSEKKRRKQKSCSSYFLAFYLFASRSTGEYAWHEFVLCECALRLCICVCRDEGTFSASEHTTKLCHFRRRFLLLLRTMRSERRESGEAFRLHADVLSFSLSAVARCLKVGE